MAKFTKYVNDHRIQKVGVMKPKNVQPLHRDDILVETLKEEHPRIPPQAIDYCALALESF